MLNRANSSFLTEKYAIALFPPTKHAARLFTCHLLTCHCVQSPAQTWVNIGSWNRRSRPNDACAKLAPWITSAARLTNTPSFAEQQEFEQLWFEYCKELSISTAAAKKVHQGVEDGLLPCDATAMRARAVAFLELAKQVQAANLRQILNENPEILAIEHEIVRQRIVMLLQLLPQYDGTTMLRTVVPELPLEPQLLAIKYMELQELFRAAFDANLPPAVFSFLVHTPLQHHVRDCQDVQPTHSNSPSLTPGVRSHASDISLMGSDHTELGVAAIQARLIALAAAFGSEVAYLALSNTPQLLLLDPATLQQQHSNVAALLKLPELRALYLLQNHGSLLCLPFDVLRARHAALATALRWSPDEAERLVRHDPGVLLMETDVISEKWSRIRQLCARRRSWARELDECTLSLASGILQAGADLFDRLEYLLLTNLRPEMQLRQLVRERVEGFCAACPKFRRWLVLREAGRDTRDAAGYSGLVRVQFE
jgi:hypothetical protein